MFFRAGNEDVFHGVMRMKKTNSKVASQVEVCSI